MKVSQLKYNTNNFLLRWINVSLFFSFYKADLNNKTNFRIWHQFQEQYGWLWQHAWSWFDSTQRLSGETWRVDIIHDGNTNEHRQCIHTNFKSNISDIVDVILEEMIALAF